jgi:hypothetical protein
MKLYKISHQFKLGIKEIEVEDLRCNDTFQHERITRIRVDLIPNKDMNPTAPCYYRTYAEAKDVYNKRLNEKIHQLEGDVRKFSDLIIE